MTKSQTTETTESVETVSSSRKRDITAVVASTSVTVALGIAANILIGKVASQVHDRIAPKPQTESK